MGTDYCGLDKDLTMVVNQKDCLDESKIPQVIRRVVRRLHATDVEKSLQRKGFMVTRSASILDCRSYLCQNMLTMRAFLLLVVGLMANSFLFAQKKPVTPPTPPASRIALVRAAEFYNEHHGILRLAAAQTKLMEAIRVEDSSYRKQLANLETLKQEITSLERDASKQSDVAMKRALVPQLERDVEERKFMLDEAYRLKERELIAPAIRAIIEELDAYRQAKKYTIVLNADNLNENGTLLSFDASIDITADFIQHYNKKFPLH